MRLPWSTPKHTPLEHIVGNSPEALRTMSDADLYRYIAGWAPGSEFHIAGMAELRRREGKVAKVAIWLAAGSLLVSFVALFKPS